MRVRWFIREGHFHYEKPGRVGEGLGPDSCPRKTRGKLIKAVTHRPF